MNQIQLNRNEFSMTVNSNAPAFDDRVAAPSTLAPNDYTAIHAFQAPDNRMFPNELRGENKKENVNNQKFERFQTRR